MKIRTYPEICHACKYHELEPNQEPCVSCGWDKEKQAGTEYIELDK